MQAYLTTMRNQIQNLSLELNNESSSIQNLQHYLQNVFPQEINDLIRSQVHDLVHEKVLELVSQNNLSGDFVPLTDFLKYKEETETELHKIRAGMEDLLFVEPPNPVVLESSIQDQINILFKEKTENLENFLEQRLKEFKNPTAPILPLLTLMIWNKEFPYLKQKLMHSKIHYKMYNHHTKNVKTVSQKISLRSMS